MDATLPTPYVLHVNSSESLDAKEIESFGALIGPHGRVQFDC